jgi:hypothetical protein
MTHITIERAKLEQVLDIRMAGDFLIIELGYGLVEVSEGSQGDKPALIFGRNGSGEIGEATKPNRVHEQGETLAVVTFENAASLDVVAGKLKVLRDKHFPPAAQPAQHTEQELYHELLFAVAKVHPNETRHQTALRYIQQAESGSADRCTAAHGIKENT